MHYENTSVQPQTSLHFLYQIKMVSRHSGWLHGSRATNLIYSVFITLIVASNAWDNDDFELFDMVEDINRNFYEVLGVDQVKFL